MDGVPISKSGGTLNDINPNDIESMEILKDASASFTYLFTYSRLVRRLFLSLIHILSIKNNFVSPLRHSHLKTIRINPKCVYHHSSEDVYKRQVFSCRMLNMSCTLTEIF